MHRDLQTASLQMHCKAYPAASGSCANKFLGVKRLVVVLIKYENMCMHSFSHCSGLSVDALQIINCSVNTTGIILKIMKSRALNDMIIVPH